MDVPQNYLWDRFNNVDNSTHHDLVFHPPSTASFLLPAHGGWCCCSSHSADVESEAQRVSLLPQFTQLGGERARPTHPSPVTARSMGSASLAESVQGPGPAPGHPQMIHAWPRLRITGSELSHQPRNDPQPCFLAILCHFPWLLPERSIFLDSALILVTSACSQVHCWLCIHTIS